MFVLGSTTFPSAQSTTAAVAAAQWRYHSVLRGRYILKSIKKQVYEHDLHTYIGFFSALISCGNVQKIVDIMWCVTLIEERKEEEI